MHDTALRDELLKHLEHLSPELQRQVLELSKAMARSASRGVPGKQLLRFSGIMSPEDARAIAELVEAGCEQVDHDEW
jgi:hypothetical protein